MPSQECASPLLALVRGFVAEVHPRAKPPSVTLDSTFDNLGIGSLELAELLLRVQDKFGVTLRPHILASAETPRDLVAAVARAHPTLGERRGVVSLRAAAPGGPEPDTASTLNDALDWRVSATPDRTHIRLLGEAAEPLDLSYARLQREAGAVAPGLIAPEVI